MDDMVRGMALVMDGRVAEILSLDVAGLWQIEIARGYNVAMWLRNAHPDVRALVMGMAARTDFPEEAGSALNDRFQLSEFHLSEQANSVCPADARGLGAAYLLRGVGLSLATEPRWDAAVVSLRHRWLEWSDGDSRTREETIEVFNVSRPDKAGDVRKRVLRRDQGRVNDLDDLVARKERCFPHLSFGVEVDRQIRGLPPASLSLLVRKLVKLDDACRRWRGDDESRYPRISDCRPESESTMQRYGHLRVFRDEKGGERTYRRHVSLTRAYRIHLRIQHDGKKIEIGYVGKHLPTSTFH